MRERWKSIAGFEGLYEVSDQGRVRSLARVIHLYGRFGRMSRSLPQKMLKPQKHDGGYAKFTFWKNGVDYQRFLHTLVLTAFKGARPAGMQACHNNGDKADNRLANLRWDTPSANQLDRERHGTGRIGRRFTQRTKDAATVARIRALGMRFNKTEVARITGFSRTTVADVINRRTHRV